MKNLPIVQNKECVECTKCCEGWLHAKINDQILFPGNHCIFLKIGPNDFGCSNYTNRPIRPCKTFNCLWVTDNMPDNLKPSISGVIPTRTMLGSHAYIFLVNAPKYPSNELINWFKNNYNDKNLLYFNKEDDLIALGSSDFINVIMENKEDIYIQHNKLKSHYIKN